MDYKKIAEESKASQGKNELLWLLNQLDSVHPKVIVEIGVHQGYSLDVWHEAFDPEQLYGIDIDLSDADALKIAIRAEAYISNSDSHSDFALNKLIEVLNGRKVDFLFIDGDHTFEGVKKDFEMYSPLVRKGGIIAFDDMDLFDNPTVEVHAFWQIVKDKYPCSWKHDDSNGIGVLYV